MRGNLIHIPNIKLPRYNLKALSVEIIIIVHYIWLMMTIEAEMRNEIRKLEREIDSIDDELEKLHTRIIQLIATRKKKEHDMRILRANFELSDEKDMQTTLERLLRER